jgi:cytosine/adenosine deaminase-related metal-dependent hydrolase
MRNHALVALLLLLALAPLAAAQTGLVEPPAGAPAAVAFVDVHVVPMDSERVIERQTVLVRDGRIAAMGPAGETAIPDDALVVDGAGRYLMPGLAEMHAHIPSPQQGEEVIERTLFLFLANGVTTLRGMLGHPHHLELRERSASGEILAPRIYTSSPSLNGNSAPDAETARRLVAEHHAAGYDFLKIHPGLSREVYDAMAEAASGVGIQWAGHVPAGVGLDRALEVGQITIDHLDAYVDALAGHGGGFSPQDSGFFGIGFIDDVDPARIDELAAATRDAGVWNVPTEALLVHLFSPDEPEEMIRWPEMRFVPPQTLQNWVEAKHRFRQQAASGDAAARYLQVRRDLILALHRAGAPLLLGADAPQFFNVPGFATLRELQYMVDAGLTPYEALVTGTRRPAEFFGEDDWGTVAVGNIADLVLVDANPLADASHASRVHGVMVRGAWLDRATLDARLAEIERAVAE